ncbi:coil containing protein [Vibrio phage 1.052.A._10N.286.46.C3]|nr:coil containing protein [Vibrio phage 1.052.A._10N.286.46.C3]
MSDLKMSGLPDCGDNSCFFDKYRAEKPKGIRTNGGCRCKPHHWQRSYHQLTADLAEANAEIELLRVLLNDSNNAISALSTIDGVCPEYLNQVFTLQAEINKLLNK